MLCDAVILVAFQEQPGCFTTPALTEMCSEPGALAIL